MPYEPGKFPTAEARVQTFIHDLLDQVMNPPNHVDSPSSPTGSDSASNSQDHSAAMNKADLSSDLLVVIPDQPAVATSSANTSSYQRPQSRPQHSTSSSTHRSPATSTPVEPHVPSAPIMTSNPPPISEGSLARPHERLHADIPRLHNRAMHAYIHPPTAGPYPNDCTSVIQGQEWAAPDNLPIGLSCLERPIPLVVNNQQQQQQQRRRQPGPMPYLRYLRDAHGKPRTGALGQPLYDLPILGLAETTRISTAVEAWRVAMWMCYDARVTIHDVTARMPWVRDRRTLGEVEERLGRELVAWCERNCGFAPPAAARDHHGPPTARDVALVGRLCAAQVRRNTVWDVFEKEGTGEVFVAQPGGNRFGAMWKLEELVLPGDGYSMEVLLGWVNDALSAGRVIEDTEGWLSGGLMVIRERPPWEDVERCGMHWALSRWIVEMASQPPPPVQTSTYRSSYNSPDAQKGYYNPYACPAAASGPAANVPVNNGDVKQRASMAPMEIQPQRSMGPPSTGLITLPDRFSNIRLPSQDQGYQATQPPSSTLLNTQATSNGLPRLVAQPDGTAIVQRPVVSPALSLTQANSNATPHTFDETSVVLERFRQAYSHLSDQELARAHADTLRRPDKEALMRMIQERRRGNWESDRARYL